MEIIRFKKCGVLFALLTISVFILSVANYSAAAEYCVSNVAELQSALTSAAGNGGDDLIKIQQGNYIGNFVYASTQSNSVTIEGGYAAGCASRLVDATNTVLDGGNAGVVLALSAPNVSATFVVEGITLRNGDSYPVGGLYVLTKGGEVTLSQSRIINDSGSGLYAKIDGGKVNLDNNTISNNSYSGVYLLDVDEVNLNYNTISANDTGWEGGGIYLKNIGTVAINENIIMNNSSDGSGGGIRGDEVSTVSLINNTINNNSSNSLGGGGYFYDSSAVTLINNNISNNISETSGGGICVGNTSTVTLVNNNINNNSTVGANGGGVKLFGTDNVTLINNVIYYNEAKDEGGGISIIISIGTFDMTNNTIINNTCGLKGGGGVYLWLGSTSSIANIYNNIILYNNTTGSGADLYINNDGDNDIFPSIVNLFNNDFDQSEDGIYIERTFSIDPSNLNNANPLYVDPANDDYHLGVGSPCINVGDNAAPEIPDLDKDGNPRIMDGIVDMGAYEYPGAAIPIIDSFVTSPTSGEVPLTVTFACVAHDFGGSIDTYTLDYGDGGSPETNTTGLFSYEYVTTGDYDAICTVVDNDGESNTSEPVTITVTPYVNRPPVADCGQERAVVFDSIVLDGTGSSDPEGSPLSYEWTLLHEDGTVLTAYGSNPVIENLPPGFMDATLEVFDNQGASGTDTMLIAAAGSCFCTTSTMHVESIVAGTNKGKYGKATVTVYDNCGSPVPAAEVTGTFSSPFSETSSGWTDANGVAVIYTTVEVKKPSYEFCVNNVLSE
jgi:parallel beta-helix repeat protein